MRAVLLGGTVLGMQSLLNIEMAKALVAERQRQAEAFARARGPARGKFQQRALVRACDFVVGRRDRAAALISARHNMNRRTAR